MAAFPHMTLFFLLSCTLTHVSSDIFQHREYSRWPKPPCKMYRPVDYFYGTRCPEVASPVCASNGHTYQNECFFCTAQWEYGNSHIQFVKYGKCD